MAPKKFDSHLIYKAVFIIFEGKHLPRSWDMRKAQSRYSYTAGNQVKSSKKNANAWENF